MFRKWLAESTNVLEVNFMQKSVQRIVEEVKFDENLTPYFVDYIGENVKMNIAKNLQMRSSNFVEKANSTLSILLNKLEKRVPQEYTDKVLDEVCRYYASVVFVNRPQN